MIAEGGSAAQAVDAYLMGASDLPAPVHPVPCRQLPGNPDRLDTFSEKAA